MSESKIKHLEFIQAVVSRMASNSFQLKGWSVTLVAAIIVLAAKDGNRGAIPVAFLPVVTFWFLDAYYLRQERLFRELYDAARISEGDLQFSMITPVPNSKVESLARVAFSTTVVTFHASLGLAVSLAWVAAHTL